MLKIAHRGASGQYPENTLLAFAKALEMGADALELDVHVCKTGEPVVIHDDTLERTTTGKGEVALHTLAELKKLEAGQGEPIPTLAELFDLVAGKAVIFIELKSLDSALPVARLIQRHVREKGWRYDQLIAMSFHHELLTQAKAFDGGIYLSASLMEMPYDLAAGLKNLGAWAVTPCVDKVTPAFITDARQRGLKIFTWTVNTPERVAYAKSLGVDGIMGDFIDRL